MSAKDSKPAGGLAGKPGIFREILDNSTDGIFIIDTRGRFTYVNKWILKESGYQADEIIGKHFKEFIPKKYLPKLVRMFQKSMKGRPGADGNKPVEIEFTCKDGRRIPVSYKGSVLRHNKKILGVHGIIRDITERKKLERMRYEFFASVTHELKGPITSILSFSDSMYRGNTGVLNEEQKEVVSYILKDSVRLRHEVDRILVFSKLDLGMKMNISDVQVKDIVDNVVDIFTLTAEEKNIRLIKRLPQKLPKIRGDVDRLTDVFNNLVGNALKFTPNRGSVTVEATHDGKNIHVRVSDTGMGIPKDSLNDVFKKFYQVDPSITKISGGSGLGLYISKQIVEQHKGTMGVESKLGKGSTFYFTLPCK